MERKQNSKKTVVRKPSAARTTAGSEKKGQKDQNIRLAAASGASARISLERFIREVKELAYQNYVNRGGWHGADLDDWLRAEEQVKEKFNIEN